MSAVIAREGAYSIDLLRISSSLSEPVFVSKKLPEQRSRPAQRPRIDIGKTHHSGVADFFGGKLRSKRKASDAESP